MLSVELYKYRVILAFTRNESADIERDHHKEYLFTWYITIQAYLISRANLE